MCIIFNPDGPEKYLVPKPPVSSHATECEL